MGSETIRYILHIITGGESVTDRYYLGNSYSDCVEYMVETYFDGNQSYADECRDEYYGGMWNRNGWIFKIDVCKKIPKKNSKTVAQSK